MSKTYTLQSTHKGGSNRNGAPSSNWSGFSYYEGNYFVGQSDGRYYAYYYTFDTSSLENKTIISIKLIVKFEYVGGLISVAKKNSNQIENSNALPLAIALGGLAVLGCYSLISSLAYGYDLQNTSFAFANAIALVSLGIGVLIEKKKNGAKRCFSIFGTVFSAIALVLNLIMNWISVIAYFYDPLQVVDLLYPLHFVGCLLLAIDNGSQRVKNINARTQGAIADDAYISLGKHIVLCLFTCGFWYLIWTYKTTKYLNSVPNVEQYNPASKMLLCMFISFYSIFWFYKHGQRLDMLSHGKKLNRSDMATTCLILGIFIPFVAIILMQDRINQLCQAGDTAVESTSYARSEDRLDALKKLKELLDGGILTQEEFDAKKKQLLGL